MTARIRALLAGIATTIALTFVLPRIVGAQQPAQKPPPPSRMWLVGGSYGAPSRLAANVGVFLPTTPISSHQLSGFLVDADAGPGALGISAGRAIFEEYFGLDLRGVLQRTFTSPRHATPHATYVGAEAGMRIAYVRVRAGVARRVVGEPGAHATIFTWSLGAQVPFWR